MKITEKLQRQRTKEPSKPTFSFEFFVPKTLQGVQNLYDRMDRMYLTNPQFIDITWNAGGKVSMNNANTNDLIHTCQSVLGLETCMHLTCTNMPVEKIDEALQKAYDSGCQNILALRGDPPVVDEKAQQSNALKYDGFNYAKDLVKHIRDKYGDYFCIGVAAYPEGHPEENNVDILIDYLEEKVNAGADFIITQMFYDTDSFIEWCGKVRAKGIDIPIIPGIMPIMSYDSFLRRAKWCQINIPKFFLDKLDPVKEDDQAVRLLGTDLVVEMCQKLLDSGYVTHLHMYTMNLEKGSLIILEKLKIIPPLHLTTLTTVNQFAISTEHDDNLPWRKSLNPQRKNEMVRPIFWQRRPYSYVARTSEWEADEFPNGRFGDPNSPAFGGLDLLGSSLIRQSGKNCLQLWGHPTTLKDFGDLIVKYISGDLKCLPWSDTPITSEVDSILHYLKDLNKHLIFTINSQPKVNGLPSNDKVFGWGPKNGFIYQKGYLEFLLPKAELGRFLELVNSNDSLTYYAIDNDSNLYSKDGSEKENADSDNASEIPGSKANSVTWGIFPGREVLQPTIVEKESFLAWKDEFYEILRQWKINFDNHEGNEKSADLINSIINDYILCNVVDNNFISPEQQIYSLLTQLY
ncbi:probable Methylenetetrahydrofolate reductase 2 [Saccharomycodes ludwigii]|uniref:Probable Methylenetetrahydrofolate reductase 2 n=1 Tax=Saccharomycodes ludwigii TaxID=36035 RepID=A0A376B3U5_9ASCO|nr:hypothetical protein SCDLUD_000993 [Saccharomycodes ludwigii]KAH3903364.1 hypothetical protein SCDLUD_000993 [Saccharomycodes ludwigii]SSD58790.1 probable Methylenetetrahydrofolate reductase 2 [Saccharomycodes ludwigii]